MLAGRVQLRLLTWHSLLAIMLGRLRIPLQETIDRWMVVAKSIMPDDSSRRAFGKAMTTTLGTNRLEVVLQEAIGEDWESKLFQDETSSVDTSKVYVDLLPYRQMLLQCARIGFLHIALGSWCATNPALPSQQSCAIIAIHGKRRQRMKSYHSSV